jgi:hypothetical protein
MNETTRFQIERWLKDIIVRHVWNQLRICWIDIYLESLDLIISNASKQFIARKFKQYAFNMSVKINTVSIETHHSIDMIERYHDSFRRMYAIIIAKISDIDSNSTLQMTFKALNDFAELNELILTLLVFETYFRMIEMNALSSTIIQRFVAMRKIMNEVRKSIAVRQVNDTLNIRNDSFSILIHALSLNSDVFVYRESNNNQSESWRDSFKFLNINDESMIIELSNDSTKFRSTTINSYYDDHVDLENSSLFISIIDFSIIASVSKSSIMSQSNDQFVVSNQESESEIFSNSFKRDRDRFRKYFASTAYLSFVFSTTVDLAFDLTSISLLAVAFKFDSIVHIALFQFAASRQKKINDLIEKDVFQSVNKNDVPLSRQEWRIARCSHFQLSIRRRDQTSRHWQSVWEISTRNADIQRSEQESSINSIIDYSTSQSTFDCMSHRRLLEDEFISEKHHSDVRSINHVIESWFLRSFICWIDQASRHWLEQHTKSDKITVWCSRNRQSLIRHVSCSSCQ